MNLRAHFPTTCLPTPRLPTALLRTTLLATLVALAGLSAPSPAHAADPAERRAAAPGFSLKDLSGKPVKLSDFKGKVVVVNFWATWCAPCLQELPFLEQYYKRYGKDGLVVLAIATDGPETASRIPSVVRRKRWSMPVLHDAAGTVVASLNPRATNPYTLFIDKKGRVAFRHEGYSPGDEKKYEGLIRTLLGEK